MKLRIFFVLKLMFFISIDLSGPYEINDYHPEMKFISEIKAQTTKKLLLNAEQWISCSYRARGIA
jgi:hypothetical protein